MLAFAAVVVGIGIVVLRAPKHGFDREDALHIVTWTVVAGFVGSHVFSEIAWYPDRVREDPLVLLRLWGTMSSFGGIAGGILGGWIVLWREGRSRAEMLRFIDAVAFAFPFAWIFGRGGCALAHDHPGIASSHWLAVRFPEGPHFDLGLLELLYTIPIAAAFLVLDRKPRPSGFYVGLFFTLYAPARFALDELRIDEVLYLGWTPSQYFCVVMAVLGLVALRAAAKSDR